MPPPRPPPRHQRPMARYRPHPNNSPHCHPMRPTSPRLLLACLAAAISFAGSALAAKAPSAPDPGPLDKSVCLGCHGNEGFSMPDAQGKPRDLSVKADKFDHSVHGKRQCTECHRDITEIPHKPGVQHKVSCVTCHDELWKKAQQEGTTRENARLGW